VTDATAIAFVVEVAAGRGVLDDRATAAGAAGSLRKKGCGQD
jgi:hypothetical protein